MTCPGDPKGLHPACLPSDSIPGSVRTEMLHTVYSTLTLARSRYSHNGKLLRLPLRPM
ncbi:unnamed protein product [Gulo gulo]|uniref:Uncharacterized protein n=1 Tax=Gulo gulo TaxID=48420 RepID=A0A9X9LKC6_GULGU|nr:unnamed protein product [Gulo gulo]